MERCQRLTPTEGSRAPPSLLPMTPPSRVTAPPPHLNGEEGPRSRTLYGRRRGKKLRAGQEALLDTLLPKLLVTVPPEPQKIDLPALFGSREIWLEVGFGAG